jgi:hypothetical protein
MMEENKKKRLGPTHSIFMKSLAFILCILMLCVTAVSAVCIAAIFSGEIYVTPEEDMKKQVFSEYAEGLEYSIMQWYRTGSIGKIENLIESNNIDYVKIESSTPHFSSFEYQKENRGYSYMFTSTWGEVKDHPIWGTGFYEIGNNYDPNEYSIKFTVTVNIGISQDIENYDELYWMALLVEVVYALRFWIYAIAIG